MQRIFSLGAYAPIRYIIIAVLVLPGWQMMYGQNTPKLQNSGNKPKPPKSQLPLDSVFSWNILFKQNTNAAAREQAITIIKDSLTSYYRLNHHDTIPVFDSAVYCPCDSLLYNLNIRFKIEGQDGGGSLSSPTPQKPGPAGTGDYVAVQHISNNNFVKEMEPDGKLDTAHRHPIALSFFGKPDYNKSVLAIIDTGIDTTLFPPNFSRLIWRRSGPGSTMYNFLPHQNLDSLRDDHRGRHGTLVTILALKAYATGVINPKYPRIMILKALDAKKTGSVFSVSCALSYARQNKATVVNASLGYLGESDPVLRYYIKQCDNSPNNPILVFAAAGNILGERNKNLCYDPPLSTNQLTESNTFYPACWSTQLKHVITITGLNEIGRSCYYQNYSNRFVSLGVKNRIRVDGQVRGTCGSYKAPFSGNDYEGSSLATPIACGLLLRNMLNRGLSTRQLIHAIAFPGDSPTGNIIYQGPSYATRGGKYLVFPIKH